MKPTTSEQNKTLGLKAFDTLFNKRDYVAAERNWCWQKLPMIHVKNRTNQRDGNKINQATKTQPPDYD